MKFSSLVLALLTVGTCWAQVGGGSAAYQQERGRDDEERRKRVISQQDLPPTAASTFVEASVLMNVKADEYVAVFGITREGDTPAECVQKVDAVVSKFSGDLKQLGVGPKDTFVDFVVQNRIYGFTVEGNLAKEKLTGFELKKNVSIHYKDGALLDRLVAAAARSEIYDLIKVDYVVRDTDAIQNKLMEEASRVIKRKAANYERLLGIKLVQPAQVYAERHTAYFPSEMYDSYQAFEAEDVNAGYDVRNQVVQRARKNRTFYFNPLTAKTFDHVINPVILEPVVQFSVYVKVKYETAKGAPNVGLSSRAKPRDLRPAKTSRQRS